MEETYANSDGERVRWAFERVATLDMLPEQLASGTEVYSEPHGIEDAPDVTFATEFSPEQFQPGQTGVSPT